ncbi:MAG: M90 family metallopeptidase [Pseudomonadota bacterium]
MPTIVVLAVLILCALGVRILLKRQKRANLLKAPLSVHQRSIVVEQVPLTTRLPEDLQAKLEGKINLFLDQVDFVGCDGLDVTEQMRLSIAAQACLLVVNNGVWYTLRTILLYPGAFTSRRAEYDGFVVTERQSIRLGESWSRGPVVLSWEHSEDGGLHEGDGQNVVFHEFAHQLDGLSGHTDAAPLLSKGQKFADWEHVIVTRFERHVQNVEAGRDTVLDEYGAESPVEFFAVAVEVFFEKPARLLRDEPELYHQLAGLFRLEPHSWD